MNEISKLSGGKLAFTQDRWETICCNFNPKNRIGLPSLILKLVKDLV